MELTKLDIELIDAYIRNELDESQKASVELRLLNDTAFKKQHDFLLATAESLRLEKLNDHLERLKSIEQSEKVAPSQRPGIFTLNTKWMAIAASIMLLSVFTFLLSGGKVNKQIIDENFVHVSSDLHVKRTTGATSEDELKIKAYNLYEIEAYKDAAPLLLSLFRDNNDTTSLYYAGLSYLASYNLKKASECLSHPALKDLDFEIDNYLILIDQAKK